MGTRFTRVTVVSDRQQIDVSLPTDAAVSEQLPMVLRMLSVPTGGPPIRWVLSTSEHGLLSDERSLDESGVLDGAVLHLTAAADAALPPFVDDVEAVTADAVAELSPKWADATRTSGVGALLGALLLFGVGLALGAPRPAAWLVPAIAAVIALLIGLLVRERGGWWAGLVAVPAAAGAVIGAARVWAVGLGHWTGPGPLVMVAAAGSALALVGMVRREAGVLMGGLTTAAFGFAAYLARHAGLPADRTAGLVLVIAVVVVALAGQVALGGAGLINLLSAHEQGDQVARAAVLSAARRGQTIATGVVSAAGLAAALAIWVLIGSRSGWIDPALGAVGTVVFALRARMFTRARQVLPMLAVAVVGAVAATLAAPHWWHAPSTSARSASFALLAVLVLVVAALGLTRLAEVPGARVRRLLEVAETLTVISLLPGLMVLFNVIPAVQRWLG